MQEENYPQEGEQINLRDVAPLASPKVMQMSRSSSLIFRIRLLSFLRSPASFPTHFSIPPPPPPSLSNGSARLGNVSRPVEWGKSGPVSS